MIIGIYSKYLKIIIYHLKWSEERSSEKTMAASIKISELNSLTDLTDVDLFLVSDMETGTSRKISYNNLKSNVISDATSALSDLENVVYQNQTDFDARINVLETDPVTKTYVDNKV